MEQEREAEILRAVMAYLREDWEASSYNVHQELGERFPELAEMRGRQFNARLFIRAKLRLATGQEP